MDIEKILSDLILKEDQYKLDNFRIAGLPVWNILKYDLRHKYLMMELPQISVTSSNRKVNKLEFIRTISKSFIMFVRVLVFPKKVDNVFFGFSRWDYFNDEYIDRFIDPVIDYSSLNNNYLYFEYGKMGFHRKPRKGQNRIIYTDYLYLSSLTLSYFLGFFFYLLHYKKIHTFVDSLQLVTKNNISPFYISRKLLEFKFNSIVFYYILKRIDAKRLFGVSRILFKHASYAAKRRGLPVYEFQHGITLGVTRLYGGNYINDIDPDYFFLFGESCSKDVFGIPANKTIDIGFAFLSYIKMKGKERVKKNACLMISEPQISNLIIDATIELATKYPQIQFDIRRHPQEVFTQDQYDRIKMCSNIEDVTNSENSFFVIGTYDYILGENSTVLYEALSLGKKVARLNICGLHPVSRKDDDVFYYIDSAEDFDIYIYGPIKPIANPVYSDFKVDLFNSFINN